MTVEFGEGEGPGIAEERGQVVDAVENGDDVEEGGQEAYNILCEDGFGDVDAWFGDFFREMRNAVAVAWSDKYKRVRGISYGVPTAYAPLSMPKQKTKPSLVQPVWFCHSFQTKEWLA